MNFKKTLFLAVFLVAAFVAMNLNFSPLVGAENQFFTVFQFFGPMAGAFLGTPLGILAVLGSQLLNMVVFGKAFSLLNILRLLPMLFAVFYFAKFRKDKLSNAAMVVIPLVAMLLFMTHPIAGQAWYFSLYWLIPPLGILLPNKIPGKLFLRSLGATFTTHAVGGVIWLYTVPMTAAQWTALVPVVAFERLLFASGIAVSYVVANTLLDKLPEKVRIEALHIDKAYVLGRQRA
ncbi:hypothetical protein J4419_03785 [Candidatus Woesearchaeota archaeon]|nr:hypothetical protein [Candidatus Woesearchaeota archaeon]